MKPTFEDYAHQLKQTMIEFKELDVKAFEDHRQAKLAAHQARLAQLATARALKQQQTSNNMKTDGTVPKEGEETMNQENLDDNSSDVEMIDETPVQDQDDNVIDLSDDDDDGAISP